MWKIIAIDRATGEVIEETTRDSFTAMAVYCMATESAEIECRVKENA
jgi:hypothetical protein